MECAAGPTARCEVHGPHCGQRSGVEKGRIVQVVCRAGARRWPQELSANGAGRLDHRATVTLGLDAAVADHGSQGHDAGEAGSPRADAGRSGKTSGGSAAAGRESEPHVYAQDVRGAKRREVVHRIQQLTQSSEPGGRHTRRRLGLCHRDQVSASG